MTIRHAGAWFSIAAAAALVLSGCSDDAAAPSATSAPSTVSVTVTESATAASPASSTAPNTQGPPSPAPVTGQLPVSRDASSGARLTVTDVRVGRHDGFDRVVFEFGGVGTPGWRIDFTTDPRQDGSGNPVAVPGASIVAVTITGVGYPGDTGVPAYSGPDPVPGVGNVTQVNLAGVFEGQQLAFIGVDADRPAVQVSALSGPTRLVIDIAR